MKIVPEQYREELSDSISDGDLSAFKELVEKHDIDVDAYVDDELYEPVVMEILGSYGIENEEKRLSFLRYVLEKGANPNMKSRSGYNCLHIAAEQLDLHPALDLFLDFGGDVNMLDSNGSTIPNAVIRDFPWQTEGNERQRSLDILEKIMMAGADLDAKNKFGGVPRQWLEHAPEDVVQLVKRCERLNPVYTPGETLQPVFPDNLQYPEIAKEIWKNLVPPSGQADTVQGELLRAIEKLRDEAQRNGNINYCKSHKLSAQFVMDTLIGSKLFDKKEMAKITRETKKLMKATEPYTNDDVYDFLTDKACEFYLQNRPPITHKHNPEIM